MNIKIVTDSASDMLELSDVSFASVPLHIIVGEKEFTDNASLDTNEMQEALNAYKGKTSTSCPSPHDWMEQFEGADAVFCVTITSKLSGSYASANTAKDIYTQDYPDVPVYVIDSLSTGSEMVLIILKLRELILEGLNPEEIYEKICAYQERIQIIYSLASLNNLARNGRVSPILAKGIGLLGIRIIGTTHEGTLKPFDKARGDNKAVNSILSHMKKAGYTNGKVVITHNNNEAGANAMKDLITSEFGTTDFAMFTTRGLDSYYAEPGSILVGFEK